MKSKYLLLLPSLLAFAFSAYANNVQKVASATTTATVVSTDTLYYVDFNVKPATFTAGDYDIIAAGSTGSKTVNGITFCGGAYGERIHIKTTATVTTSGNYSPATTDDTGANVGAISFIASSTGNGGGYMTLPKIQGPADITVWACGANTANTQSYKVESSADGSTWTSVGTFSTTDRYIHKSVFSYLDTAKVYLKFTCTTGSKANANLYFYDVLVTQRPSIVRTSATGTDSQIITIGESLTPLVYAWGGDASSTTLTWTGTASSTTPPDGVTVTPDATAKTITISGTPTVTGSFGLSITSTYTSGSTSITTSSLTASFTVHPQEPIIELTSASATNTQSVLIDDAITNVQYTWRGSATGASIVWTGTANSSTAPDGVTATIDNTAETLTISGSPTTAGTYGWSVTSTDGTDTSAALTGTLTVLALPTIKLSSASGTNAQTLLIGDALTNVQYTWKNSATGVVIAWTGTSDASTAPSGITFTTDNSAQTFTISGTPTAIGTYGWSIYSTDGTNLSSTLSGVLNVLTMPTLSLTSSSGSDAQSVSYFQKLTSIGYSYGGSATSASVTWSGTPGSTYAPAGITVTTNTTSQTITISGTPMITGTYTYTITGLYNTRSVVSLKGTITVTAASSMLPSFPGAVGYGAHATGGRTGSVYHVTNLNDSGAGSFRDAVSASNRIVVFDIGGYINLATAISAKSNLTIAGQTAPGGIAISGGELSFANSSNVICRDIRVRPGSTTVSCEDDALSLYLANNVILDHCSFEFAPYNNIDGVSDSYQDKPVTGITFQNCLIADPEGLQNSGWKIAGQQFGAHCESVISQWTFYRTIFANSHNRNPLAKINENFVNNVLYNCEDGYTAHTSTPFSHDVVNNYFVKGPASISGSQWFQVNDGQIFYLSGNLMDSNYDSNLDGTTTSPTWTGTVLTAPWSELTATIPTYDTPSAFRINASLSGAFPYDELDSLIINQVRSNGAGTASLTGNPGPDSGLYNSQADTGLPNNGFGTITAGTKPTDTDGDGMPDYWETANGSNVNVDDAMTIASDGYTLIEHYINWLSEPHALALSNSTVDVDLTSYTGGFAVVSPTYSIDNITNGSAAILSDGHTVRFTPTTGFTGLGGFRFTVSGSDGSSYQSTVSIAITSTDITSGVNNVNATAVTIYPNPATNTITVDNCSYSAYSIVDALSRTVATGKGDTSVCSQTINVSTLPAGIYFLKLTGNHNNEVLRFIKK